MEDTFKHTKKRKGIMIDALREHRGLVSRASAACGICRATYYKWMKEDPDFAKAVDEIQDYVLDEVEDTAMSMVIEDRNPVMTIFYLKCKGKKRGFVERQEIEHSISDNLKESVGSLLEKYGKEY